MSSSEQLPFSIEMSVRDYECDMQGIVNNSVYQNYLEHARHCFLKHHGLDFAEYTRAGIHLVVIRAELDYKASLVSGDDFRVEVRMVRESKVRFAFEQTIIRLGDEKTIMKARIIGTSLNPSGRPSLPEDIVNLFG